MMDIREGILLAFLGINAISDIKAKRILIWSVWVLGIFGLLYGFISKELMILQVLITLLPGIIFLIISKVTKESLGYGDGIVVLVMGVFINMQKLVRSLMLALLFAALWSIILMIFWGKKKQADFPFLPFVLLGYIGGILI